MKPVWLLIPGMFNTPEVWTPVAERLRPGMDVRVADVRTQGSIADMAADAWRQVADLPANVPLYLGGFSMGGYVAIELLAAHRDRIAGVAFVDTSARTETPETLAVREKTIGALERHFAKAVDGTILYSLHPAHHQDTALVDGMRTMMHAVGAQAAIRQIRALSARADHRAMLATLRMPALVVCGREDKVTPPELSQELAALVPGARLEWMEEAGHQTPLEQPDRLAQLLATLVGAQATN